MVQASGVDARESLYCRGLRPMRRSCLYLLAVCGLVHATACLTRESATPFREARDPDLTLAPPAGFFAPERPKLIVLLHGLNPERATDLAAALAYWRTTFLAGLVGEPSPSSLAAEDSRDSIRRHFFGVTGAPGVSLMLTYRDSRQSLAAQTVAAARQVYDLYVERFRASKDYPQILLLGHSLGGLVARCIACCPELTESGARKLGLTPEESEAAAQRMAFLKNRTVCILTLQTPHEGTPVADRVMELQAVLDQPGLQTALQQAAELLGLKDASAVKAASAFLHNLGRAAVLQDLTTASMRRSNSGDLRPDRARRDDGTLIPILAAGSRDPSSGYLSHPSRLPIVALLTPEDRSRILQTIALDVTLHKLSAKPWGVTGDPMLDQVQRTVNLWSLVKEAIKAKAGDRPDLRILLSLGERAWVPLGVRQYLTLPLYLPHPLKFVDRDVQVTVPPTMVPKGLNIPRSFKVRCPFPELGSGPTPDGLVDTDGLVSIASAVGYQVNGEPRGFAHNTYDSRAKSFGSWYRFATLGSALDYASHRPPSGTAAGQALYQNLLSKSPGPYVDPRAELPVWTRRSVTDER